MLTPYPYISKSWSVVFIITAFQLSHVGVHLIIIFISNFPIIVFNIYFFKNLHFFQPSPSLTFSSLSYLYINIILSLSLHHPLFCLFLFTPFYYKFVTIHSILCIFFSHKKRFSLSLSLALNFWVFIFYFSCISDLGW